MSDQERENNPLTYYTGMGLAVGMAVGLVFGAAIGDSGSGLALGLTFGLVIGAAIGNSKKKQQQQADGKMDGPQD